MKTRIFYFSITFLFLTTFCAQKHPPKEYFESLEAGYFYQYRNDILCRKDEKIILNHTESTMEDLGAYLDNISDQIRTHNPLDNCQSDVKKLYDNNQEDYDNEDNAKKYDWTLHIGYGKSGITDCQGGGRRSTARSILFQSLVHIIPNEMYFKIQECLAQDKAPKRIFSTASGTGECELLFLELLAAKGVLENLNFESILFSDPKYNENLRFSMEGIRHVVGRTDGFIENILYTNTVLGGSGNVELLLEIALQKNNSVINRAIAKVDFFMGFDVPEEIGTVKAAAERINFKDCLFSFMVCQGQFIVTYFYDDRPLFFLISDGEKVPQNIYYFQKRNIDQENLNCPYIMQTFNRGKPYLNNKFFIGDKQDGAQSTMAVQNFVFNFKEILEKSSSIENIINFFRLLKDQNNLDEMLKWFDRDNVYDQESLYIIDNLIDFEKIKYVDFYKKRKEQSESVVIPENTPSTSIDSSAEKSYRMRYVFYAAGALALSAAFVKLCFYLKNKNSKIV